MRLPEDMTLPDGFVPPAPPDPPAPPKDAATVVLLRDASRGPEVFLQRRVKNMPFAGGMTVFPGGGVDPRDADASIAWSGPPPSWWAERFECSEETARALVCAAVRETFEESGVLLAGTDQDTVVADTSPYAEARPRLVSRELSLAGFLSAAGLVLRADLLRPWAQWVTPVEEPKRYDTRFFLAAMPAGQRADGVTTEAAHTYWSRPAEALEEWRQGRCGLLPPTWLTLSEVGACGEVAEALAVERPMGKVLPRLVHRDGAWRTLLPGDVGYDEEVDR